jgi:hypothetical protein
MWCKSVGFVRWLAPLLILRSVGFSVFFFGMFNVRRVSLGITANDKVFTRLAAISVSQFKDKVKPQIL